MTVASARVDTGPEDATNGWDTGDRASSSPLQSVSRRPLAVSFKTAGELIDRSARTIKRMVERGDLVELPGQALVTYASLEDWVAQCSQSTSDGQAQGCHEASGPSPR